MAITLMVVALLLSGCSEIWSKPTRLSSENIPGLEDSYEHLGDEPVRAKRHIYHQPDALREIMGPLHRRHTRNTDEMDRSQAVYQRMKALLRLLRMYLGRKPHIEIYQFINWDKTIIVNSLFLTKPKTIWELRKVILAARSLRMRVRATGTGHSRSPLYVDEGNIMLDVRDLKRHDNGPTMTLTPPNSKRNYHTLTAMTGVYEYDLNEFMVRNNVTIFSQPLNNVETLGGMVAASTHGSTWDDSTYSSYVVEMRLMDSNGELRRFTIEDHKEFMKAAICNLGMFGIMYDITIKVFPAVKAKVVNEFMTLGDLIYNSTKLKEVVTSNFVAEIAWFPFNSVTETERVDYLKDGTIPSAWDAKRDELWIRTINLVNDTEVGNNPLKPALFLPSAGSLSGGNATGLLRGKASLNVAKTRERVAYHFLVDAFPYIRPPRFGTETSAAFLLNVDHEFKRPARSLQFIIEEAEKQIRANSSTPLNALLPRFFKNHECDLCPGNNDITMANDTGKTLVIDFLAPPSQYGFYSSARKFVEEFKNEKVRPHWAKRHDNIPGIIDLIKQVYGSNLHHFQRMKRQYRLDPHDMFMNNYLLAVFGSRFEEIPPANSLRDAPTAATTTARSFPRRSDN